MWAGRGNKVICAVLAAAWPVLLPLAACAPGAAVRPDYPYEAPDLTGRQPREVAALHARLAQTEQRIDELEREVSRLRSREAELQQALADAGRQEPAPEMALAAPGAVEDGEAARLRAALADEQERRQAAETQLARLREETTSPPLPGAAPDAAALQEEVIALRQRLADERSAREALARQLAASGRQQEGRAHATAEDEATPEELRARIRALEDERSAIVTSFTRNLAASDQRIAELDAQLATADRTAANAPALQKDNAELRARLDEERRRTQELAAKLRVAERITDLIFKIQAQQNPRPGAPALPPP